MARHQHYTKVGIRRLPCSVLGCSGRGYSQWNVCADKVGKRTQYRVVCRDCDIEINTQMMRFMFGDAVEDKIEAYRREVLQQ